MTILLINAFAMSTPPQSPSVTVPMEAAATFEASAPVSAEVVRIMAKQFEYIPNTFTVSVNVPVQLILRSQDVTHGFAIDDFKINVQVQKGQDTIVNFTPDKVGTFDYYCSVFCGVGHLGMRGKMIVK